MEQGYATLQQINLAGGIDTVSVGKSKLFICASDHIACIQLITGLHATFKGATTGQRQIKTGFVWQITFFGFSPVVKEHILTWLTNVFIYMGPVGMDEFKCI